MCIAGVSAAAQDGEADQVVNRPLAAAGAAAGSAGGTGGAEGAGAGARLTLDSLAPEVQAILHEMDAPEYGVREAATQRMMQAGLATGELRQLASAEFLSVEQQQRILHVLCEAIVHQPRGAMGIEMLRPMGLGVAIEQEYVEVSRLLPGLPAEKVLKAGDRITHIDGQRVRSSQDLVNLVQMRAPGERIHIQLQRRENHDQPQPPRFEPTYIEHEVDLVLGDAVELNINEEAQRQQEESRRRNAIVQMQAYRCMPMVLELAAGGEIVYRIEAEDITPERVNQHHDVAHIARQAAWVRDGTLALSDAMRQSWTNRIERIARKLEDETLSTIERQYYEAVRRRCEELIRSVDDADEGGAPHRRGTSG